MGTNHRQEVVGVGGGVEREFTYQCRDKVGTAKLGSRVRDKMRGS